LRNRSPALILLSCLASPDSVLTAGGSFAHFLTSAIACVKSTVHHIDATAKTCNEGHQSGGSTERTKSIPLSDAGSHNGAGGDMDEGSCTQSYFFGPSTMTISRIRGMIDHSYFTEGMGCECGEETILEPHSDEAVVFDEFFAAGLGCLRTLFSMIFQVQLHQFTPNAINQLSKYIWAVMSFEGIPSADGFTKRYELHYHPRKMEVDELKCRGSMGASIFMPNVEARGRSLLLPSGINGPEPGLGHVLLQGFPTLLPEPRVR
jgi:hypothetical protein